MSDDNTITLNVDTPKTDAGTTPETTQDDNKSRLEAVQEAKEPDKVASMAPGFTSTERTSFDPEFDLRPPTPPSDKARGRKGGSAAGPPPPPPPPPPQH